MEKYARGIDQASICRQEGQWWSRGKACCGRSSSGYACGKLGINGTDLNPSTSLVPGTVDGNLWNQRPRTVRDAAFAHFVETSTTRKLAREDEIAAAVVHLFLNGATTGSTIYPDGGYSLR